MNKLDKLRVEIDNIDKNMIQLINKRQSLADQIIKAKGNSFPFDPEREKYETNHNIGLKFTLILSTLFILIYFIYPSGITEIVSKINII